MGVRVGVQFLYPCCTLTLEQGTQGYCTVLGGITLLGEMGSSQSQASWLWLKPHSKATLWPEPQLYLHAFPLQSKTGLPLVLPQPDLITNHKLKSGHLATSKVATWSQLQGGYDYNLEKILLTSVDCSDWLQLELWLTSYFTVIFVIPLSNFAHLRGNL